MDLQLRDKCALVTGASSGIGRATALVLAQEGVRLALHGRNVQRLEQLASEVARLTGLRPPVVPGDLLAPDAVETIARDAVAGLGQVDILVNNAGGTRPFQLDTPVQALSSDVQN